MEQIVSPGVFTQENDLSYLPRGIGEIGAALVGPTVKGPILVPTDVHSYSDFKQVFGENYESGSNKFQYLTSHTAKEYFKYGGKLTVVRVVSGSDYAAASASVWDSGSTDSDNTSSFELHALSEGSAMNNSGSVGANQLLKLGSYENIRWEVRNVNEDKGTFTLVIRRGNDTEKRKIILETWNDLSIDPNEPNYIAAVIGDQKPTFVSNDNDPYIEMSGSYPNKSSYVRVSNVSGVLNYLDENGETSSADNKDYLPSEGSGSLGGAFGGGSDGNIAHPMHFYEDIDEQTQGLTIVANDNYYDAISLLGNQDEYDINMILTPGITKESHAELVNHTIDMCENRGDCFYVMDLANHNKNISEVTGLQSLDTSYAASYWPWVQIMDNANNKYRWVPASVVMASVIAFNDKISYEWYAPAGLTRGGIESAIRAERKLTHSNRDTLYEKSVNPLATFPGQGISAWGQKTLQKKSSALDRVNVRRLLIKAKKYIASMSRYLVFEQNTDETRQRFLNIANPYFEQIQKNQGLYAFKVVMDETLNTADIIDRNMMKGAIYLQPSKTSEFIQLDFNILPTGAEF